MSPSTALHLAQVVLGIHMAVAIFVIFGIVAVPLGLMFRWPFIFGFAWRLTHVGAASSIALQKLMGKTCFLSVWEFDLLDRASQGHERIPPFHALAIDIMHWNMPLWFFTLLYVLVLAYTLWLWRIAPPRRLLTRETIGV